MMIPRPAPSRAWTACTCLALALTAAAAADARDLGRIEVEMNGEIRTALVRSGESALPEGIARYHDVMGDRTEFSIDALGVADEGGVGPGAIILGLAFEAPGTPPFSALEPAMLADFFVMVAETWPQDADEPEFVWMTAPEDGAEMVIGEMAVDEATLLISGTITDALFCLVHVDDLAEFDEDRSQGDCRTGALSFTLDTR